VLEQTLAGLGAAAPDPRILAGRAGDNEDAVVLRFPEGRALVQSVDFFTPIVNDPHGFGRIAAANALSDIYAMGGDPLAAMNIVCFPVKELPTHLLRAILEGGQEAVLEAGAVPAGGHSVEDDEVKYGLAVSGTVDPQAMATNQGMRPGDLLVLTKPLGTGVLATALKADWEGAERFEQLLIHWCGRLNAHAGQVIRALGLRGATDVTGFGLGGHLLELCQGSGCGASLWLEEIPFHQDAVELAGIGLLPAGSLCNRNFYLPRCHVDPELDPIRRDLVFDAQSSGGLLLAVPPEQLQDCVNMLTDQGEPAYVVGRAHSIQEGDPLLRIEAARS
jgi:selenide,water dikinase